MIESYPRWIPRPLRRNASPTPPRTLRGRSQGLPSRVHPPTTTHGALFVAQPLEIQRMRKIQSRNIGLELIHTINNSWFRASPAQHTSEKR